MKGSRLLPIVNRWWTKSRNPNVDDAHFHDKRPRPPELSKTAKNAVVNRGSGLLLSEPSIWLVVAVSRLRLF